MLLSEKIRAYPLFLKKIWALRRLILVVLFLLAVGTLGQFWMRGELSMMKELLNGFITQWGGWVLLVGSIIYLLLLSLPFMPGVELGLLLMCVFGRDGILPIYLATLGGLMLAFTVGERLPKRRISSWMDHLGVSLPAGNPNVGIVGILDQSPLGPWLRQHSRIGLYLKRCSPAALAVLLNLPGNYIFGGGGGIALICGITHQFRWWMFLLTIIFAVAPVPLLVWFGFIRLEVWLEF